MHFHPLVYHDRCTINYTRALILVKSFPLSHLTFEPLRIRRPSVPSPSDLVTSCTQVIKQVPESNRWKKNESSGLHIHKLSNQLNFTFERFFASSEEILPL